MSLRLFDRIATLLRADAHGLVGALEDRALLLEQALREAELALLEGRARLAALAEEETHLAARSERRSAEIAALDEDVALALAGAREDLARFAIRRLIPLRRDLAACERESREVASARAALAGEVAAQEAELEDLRVRVRARIARGEACAERDGALAPETVDDAEVEIELLRRRGAAQPEAAR